MTRLLMTLALFFWVSTTQMARAEEVDMQLVLAIDVSSSVSWEEYDLQMRGLATAFRDQLVIEAIASGPIGQISVAVTHWAGLGEQRMVLPWRIISSPEEARAYADSIDAIPRTYPYGGTAIAEALDHAQSLFARDRSISSRRVIDISGDGKVSIGPPPEGARDRVTKAGTIINGLPIMDSARDLDVYYQEKVIGGIGAFIEIAEDFDDFTRAMTEKLAREIQGTWQGV
jgi:hypothetical protein